MKLVPEFMIIPLNSNKAAIVTEMQMVSLFAFIWRYFRKSNWTQLRMVAISKPNMVYILVNQI